MDSSSEQDSSSTASPQKDSKQQATTKTINTLSAQDLEQISILESRLWKLQELHGNFASASSEVLADMAAIYQSARQYDEASKLLRQAMQAQRVNHGLYSELQEPIAKQLVTNLVAAGQWRKAREQQEFRHWLANRSLLGDKKRLLKTLMTLGQWQLHAYVYNGRRDVAHLNAANSLYLQYIELYGQSPELDRQHEDLSKVLQGFIASNYFKLTIIEQGQQSNGFSVTTLRHDPLSQQQASNELQQQKNNIFVNGKKALESMSAIETDSTDRQRLSILNGDWHLMFGKYSTAKKYYREALAFSEEDQRPALFATPEVIPILPEWEESFLELEPRIHIKASYDIGRDGKARNLKVAEENKKYRGKIKRQLRKTQFRPSINADGNFQNSKDIQQSFSFP
ncbi:hypothetical protein [uncultured Pseudoteredinibacter sp.]|uniref:hypothetical protein n=1 Tax=uncultured Pseudoteredinibacter sp. TaxID=1641701 RepID=UPI002601F39F|nr:hypothetical protein [uncultured Pseudoteredinibacter sp.]